MKYKKQNYVFIIKAREQRHKIPHVHIEYDNTEISVSLSNFDILAGKLNRHFKKAIDILKQDANFVQDLTAKFYECNPNLKR